MLTTYYHICSQQLLLYNTPVMHGGVGTLVCALTKTPGRSWMASLASLARLATETQSDFQSTSQYLYIELGMNRHTGTYL